MRQTAAPVDIYRTRDGWVLCQVTGHPLFIRWAKLMGEEEQWLSDPRFADAHFNLAMAYEQAGERARARPHWKRYLELEPTGTWADIARKHI